MQLAAAEQSLGKKLRCHGNHNSFKYWNDLQSGENKFFNLYGASPTRYTTVADKASRLIVPFLVDIIEGVDQGRRGTVIVFGSDEHVCIGDPPCSEQESLFNRGN